MDDKVSVNIREINNGYLVDRSWCEVKGEGDKQRHEYQSETYYLASLPVMLQKMFIKGKNGKDFGGKQPEKKDSFEEALESMDGSDNAEEESTEE